MRSDSAKKTSGRRQSTNSGPTWNIFGTLPRTAVLVAGLFLALGPGLSVTAQDSADSVTAPETEVAKPRIEIVGRGAGPVQVITHRGGETQTEQIKPRPLNGLSPTIVNRERSAYDSFLAAQEAHREQRGTAQEAAADEQPSPEESESAEPDPAQEAAEREQYRQEGLSDLKSKGFMYWLQEGESYPSVVYDSWNGRFLKTDDALERTVGSFESWQEDQSAAAPEATKP